MREKEEQPAKGEMMRLSADCKRGRNLKLGVTRARRNLKVPKSHDMSERDVVGNMAACLWFWAMVLWFRVRL